jgi:hypothetical protein
MYLVVTEDTTGRLTGSHLSKFQGLRPDFRSITGPFVRPSS